MIRTQTIPSTIPGNKTFSGAVTITGNLTVNGTTTTVVDQTVTGAVTVTGDLAVNGGDLTSTATTFNLLNATVTTLNVGGAATTIALGAASTVVTLGSNATINGGAAANDGLTLQGTSHATRTTSYVILQPNGGDVGIGTTGPGAKLDVNGTGNFDGDLTLTTANLIFSTADGTYAIKSDGGLDIRLDSDADQTDRVFSISHEASGNELFRVQENGNVGIGTTSPDRLLHPELADAVTNVVSYPFRLTHITSGTPANSIGVGLEFEQETAADNNEVIAAIEAIVTDVTATGEDAALVFKTMVAGAAAAEQFRIASDGGLFAQTLLQQTAAGLVCEYDTTTKEIYAETSALRFKDNVQDFYGAARLTELRPKSWTDKVSGRNEFGLIAEEVAATVPELAVYDGDGQPIGVKYHKLSVLLLERVSRLERALLAAGIAPERVQ